MVVVLTGCTGLGEEQAPPNELDTLAAAARNGIPEEQLRGSGAGRLPTLLSRVQIGVRDETVTLRFACLDDQPLIVQLAQDDGPVTERLLACDGRVVRLRAPAAARDAVTFRASSEDSPGAYAYAWQVGCPAITAAGGATATTLPDTCVPPPG